MKKFLIEYELPYVHLVRVGVQAKDGASAIAMAQEAFDLGTIWDNTPEMPLLYDDFEESSSLDHALEFKVVDEGRSWPEPAVCVKSYVQGQAAKHACESLVAAFEAEGRVREALLHEAINQACQAMPHLAEGDGLKSIRQTRIPTAVVWLEGGVVQWVASDQLDMQYLVLDADTEGNRAMEVTMENGNSAEVLPTSTLRADSLPDWVEKLLKEIEAR
jgi:hypothetical protein